MRWVAFYIASCVFIAVSSANMVYTILWALKRKRNSFVPVIGGLAGLIAMLIVPIEGARKLAWIPLFVDVGCLPLVIAAIADRSIRAMRGKKK
jgi:hypothetical protein